MTRPTLLFYCQHSLGMGHLVRSLALAAELARRCRVVLLNGGPAIPDEGLPDGVEVVQLPPVGLDEAGQLVSRDHRRGLGRALALRGRQLLAIFESLHPDVLLIELFPFGRNKFAGELLSLLDAAQAGRRTTIVCSLRDILVSGRVNQALHDERASLTANRYFDAVLVHADPRFATLEESFRPATPLAIPVHYTGFVVPRRAMPGLAPRPSRQVLVSVGGGMAGVPLVETAVKAHALLRPEDGLHMRIVAGPFYPPDAWRALRAQVRGREGLSLRRQVPNLVAEMRRSLVSVSQCGYNTAMDLLRAGVPGLVVPFGEGGENEQLDRARRLERAGAVRVLEATRLDPPALAEAIRSLVRFRPSPVELDLDGAHWTAEWVAGLPRGQRVVA